MAEAMSELKERLGTIMDLTYAAGLLGWDQRTYMPHGGARGRAEQLATLRRLIHDLTTDPAIERLLDELAPVAQGGIDDDDAALLRWVRRDYEKQRKLPSEFVREWAKARSISQNVWEEARRRSDWTMFRPAPRAAVRFRQTPGRIPGLRRASIRRAARPVRAGYDDGPGADAVC